MNMIDLLLIVVVLLSVWAGWQKGFVLGAVNLLVWVGSLLAGFYVYQYTAKLLNKVVAPGVWTLPVAFILTIIIARIVLSLVFNPLLRTMPEKTHQHEANKVMGIFPGFANGLINAAVIAALLLALPLFEGLSASARDSKLASRFVKPADWVQEKLAPIFNEATQRSVKKPSHVPGSKEYVKLPYTVKNPEWREELEAEMLLLVNKERAKEGLKPLKADPQIALVARAHSRDMFMRGYFAHVNPDGKDAFDRIRAAKVRFLTAGENLALAQTLSLAHNGLMNSPGHRANILQPSFGRLGIGIVDGGIYGLMVTQNFRN